MENFAPRSLGLLAIAAISATVNVLFAYGFVAISIYVPIFNLGGAST